MANDIVTVWGGTPKIGRSPDVGDLLIGNGSSTFVLGGGANNNTGISQPSIGGANMEVTTIGGVTRYGFAGYYGQFYDTTNQVLGGAPTIGTETLIKCNTTDMNYGITVAGSPATQFTVANPGIYNFQFSLQVVNVNTNNTHVWVWLKKNGSTVSNSNTLISLPNKDDGYVAAWNFLVALNANDYVELAWTSDNAGTIIRDGGAPYGPSVPSAIVTMVLVR